MTENHPGWLVLVLCSIPPLACAASPTGAPTPTPDGGGTNDSGIPTVDAGPCTPRCSPDARSVVSCDGSLIETCAERASCQLATATCLDACQAAAETRGSLGCEFHAVFMDTHNDHGQESCFAAFASNAGDSPAKLTLEWNGTTIPVEQYAYVPKGSGSSLEYQPYDAALGIPPGEVAILFLGGTPEGKQAPCPRPAAVQGAMLRKKTGIGASFRIASDTPISAYQMSPYGGGSEALTGASLLLPTSAWGKSYVGVNAGAAWKVGGVPTMPPSLNVVASEDGTLVELTPAAPLVGGGGVPASAAGAAVTVELDRGEHLQITQDAELTGSTIAANKPVGVFGGHSCLTVPAGELPCDHAEQMLPPVEALGSRHVGVMHRPRDTEPGIWRLVGVVPDTKLTWSSHVGGPATLGAGESVELVTSEPFVVESQDDAHPFLLFGYMSGCHWEKLSGKGCPGDPEFVLSIPPSQYQKRYVFFADPTYPETNLVVVRAKKQDAFADVVLDCAGPLAGWIPIGDFEWTRVDLTQGQFDGVGNCNAGRHEIASDAPFGLWVWGWGSVATQPGTAAVSYGYPAGMSVRPINEVELPEVR